MDGIGGIAHIQFIIGTEILTDENSWLRFINKRMLQELRITKILIFMNQDTILPAFGTTESADTKYHFLNVVTATDRESGVKQSIYRREDSLFLLRAT